SKAQTHQIEKSNGRGAWPSTESQDVIARKARNCQAALGSKSECGPLRGDGQSFDGDRRDRTSRRLSQAEPCNARRVAVKVLISDSRGRFLTMGSITKPRPNGTSRVSEIARHSRM